MKFKNTFLFKNYNMSSFTNNKMTAFKDAVMLDIAGNKSHFLYLALGDDIDLKGDPVKIPLIDKDIPYKNGKNAIRMMLRRSCQEVFKKFDVDMYNTFDDKKGIIETMVWGCYRKRFHAVFKDLYIDMLSSDQIQKRGLEKIVLERAALKRNEKIIAEQVRLGGGDLQRGIKRWNERVNEDKIVADSRDRIVSLAQEKEFNAWLSSSVGKAFVSAPVDSSPKVFDCTLYPRINKSEMFRGSRSDIFSWLMKLQDFVAINSIKKVSVKMNLDWDESVPFSYPTTFIYNDDKSLLKLHASASISRGSEVNVIGILNPVDEGWYVTTSQTTEAHKMLPSPFTDNFRSRNPCLTLTSKCNVMRRVDHAVHHVNVYVDSNLVLIFAHSHGAAEPMLPPSPDSMEIFSPSLSAVTKAQKESSNRIEKLRKDAEERVRVSFSKVPTSDDKSSTIKDIQALTELFSKGVLDKESYTKATNNLLNKI
jgi:hypothetical protein